MNPRPGQRSQIRHARATGATKWERYMSSEKISSGPVCAVVEVRLEPRRREVAEAEHAVGVDLGV